jgi:hypothetical protein
MNTLVDHIADAIAVDVWFDETMLFVRLADGREVATPIAWFPRLKNATTLQRNNWRFIGRGSGIHWEDVDEDLSVAGLLRTK